MRYEKLLGLVLGLMTLASAARGVEPRRLFTEDFEKIKEASSLKQETSFTAAKFGLATPGQLSDYCLQAEKPDSCGQCIYRIAVPVPVESRKHWLRLSADLKTEYVGPGAEYFLMVTQLEKGKSNGANTFFAFNDGISRQSEFGGQYKTPQTSGEWARTFHAMRLRDGADQIELALVVRGGSQTLFFDNIQVFDTGSEPPPDTPPVVFEKCINWPYAILELDNLLPGCVYRIETESSWPSESVVLSKGLTPNPRRSSSRAPVDMAGMGVAMSSVDLHGAKSAPDQLLESVIGRNKRNYRLVVPPNAVKVLLDFHNDDLIRFDHNQIEYQARRWQRVSIHLENYGEIAADNAYGQYIYRKRPKDLRVRNILELGRFDIDVLKETLSTRKEAELRISKYKNGMCFMLDGKPVPPIAASCNIASDDYRFYDNLSKEGIKVFFVRLPYGGVALHGDWKGPGAYDFTDLDMNMYQALYQNPDAVIILSVDSLYPPAWWAKENPGELARDQNGNVVWCHGHFLYQCVFGNLGHLLKSHDAQIAKGDNMHQLRGAKWIGHFIPSTASEKYRKDMAGYLVAMRQHIEQQPYGKVVVGYRFLWGYDGQWGPLHESYGHDKPGVHCVDFSDPMRDRFRTFLKDKYKTEDALKKAWNDDGAAFAAASIPAAELRDFDQAKTASYLLDPQKYRMLIDYRECEAATTASLLLDFCKAVKSGSSRPIVTMAYYPDIAGACAGGGNSAYRGNSIVYNSDDFNAAGGPEYAAREIGQGGYANCLLNSLALHGKIHLSELDHRVFPVAKRNYANNLLFDSPAKSISVLRREYMRQMCFGTGSWTFDMGYGWFDDPLIAEIVGDANRVFGKVIELDRASIAQFAIFIGEYGKKVQADGRRGAIPKGLVVSPLIASVHAGVPIDQYIMSDLPLVKAQYKVFFFPFAYGLTPEEMRNIEELKRDGNVLVFGYAAGYVSDNISIENVRNLTGFNVEIDPVLGLTVRIENSGHPLIKGMAGHFMGTNGENWLEKGMPKIFVNDPDAVTLAKFVNSDKSGLAVKDHGTWKGIYIGTIGNTMPPELLRNIATFAGLHVYNDANDVMFFNKSLVAIHASSTGVKKIKLPRPAKATSMWDNLKTGKIDVIERAMKTGDNALYMIEE